MNQDLCVSWGQEGPNLRYVAQVVNSDLGNFFDMLIEIKGRIKSNTQILEMWQWPASVWSIFRILKFSNIHFFYHQLLWAHTAECRPHSSGDVFHNCRYFGQEVKDTKNQEQNPGAAFCSSTERQVWNVRLKTKNLSSWPRQPLFQWLMILSAGSNGVHDGPFCDMTQQKCHWTFFKCRLKNAKGKWMLILAQVR